MKLEIGDIGFELKTDLPFIQKQWRDLYADFVIEKKIPLLFSLHVHSSDIQEIKKPLQKDQNEYIQYSDEGELIWRLQNNSNGRYFQFIDGNVMQIESSGKVNAHCVEKSESAKYLMPEILYLNALMDTEEGLLLHASAVVREDKAYVFLGRSGAGKSTISQISYDKGLSVLNDDRVIVRKKNGRFFAFGNPWHGTFGKFENRSYEIAGLYFIHKKPEHKILPLSFDEAFSAFSKNVFLWPPEGRGSSWHFKAADLISQVPSFKMDFARDAGFWEIL